MPDDSLLRPAIPAFRRAPPTRIGAFEVRAASNELAGRDGVLRLRPRLMDVLLRLAQAPGEVVPRQVLLDDVWPRRLVADEVLSRTIAELRTALGDDAREARYVETLPKVGYRLIAPVARLAPRPAGAPCDDLPAGDTSDAARPAHASSPVHAADAPAAGVVAPVPTAVVARPHVARRALLGGAAAVLVAATTAALLHRASVAPATTDLERRLAGAVPFSSELEQEVAPRFSPDGTRIAFALGNGTRSEVVVQDVATRTRTVVDVPGGVATGPTFFPDGRRLAYYRRVDKACAIVERDLASGAERTLVGCDDRPAARFDVAPDGTHLVYASLSETDAGLRVLDLATGAVTRLTAAGATAGVDAFPRYAPDGTRIAFMRGGSGGREVWMVSATNPGDAHRVGTMRSLAYGLAWIGNAGPLLVSADWLGFRALNTLDITTGVATFAGARGAQFPDVSRNGDIVYEAASYQANLQLVDVDDPARTPDTLWPSARYTNYPQFAPDGRRVLFSSNRDNTASLFVGEIGGAARRLPLPTEFVFARAHWSHDGASLYAVRGIAIASDASQQAVRIDAATGRVDVLAGLGDRVSDLRDSADGRTLYFATQEGPLMQLWSAPVDAPDRPTRLALPLVAEYDVHGSRLAYEDAQQSDLMVCTLPALSCAPAGLPAKDGRTGWALTDAALWVGYAGDPGELVRFDLDRRAVTARLPHGPSALGPNVAVAPDERRVVVSRQDAPAIDLMLARHAR